MTSADELFKSCVGKKVRDAYGTYMGYIVGLSMDASGQLISMGLDAGLEGFVELPKEHLVLENEQIVKIPQWKTEVDRFVRETNLVQKRLFALEELRKEAEITEEEYGAISNVYQEKAVKLKEFHSNMTKRLNDRLQYLDVQVKVLRRFSTGLKLQYKSGEVSAESFGGAMQCITDMRDRVERERKDIGAIVNGLNPATFGPNEQATTTQPASMRPEESDLMGIIDKQVEESSEKQGESSWLQKILRFRE